MRRILVLALAALLLTGCAPSHNPPAAVSPSASPSAAPDPAPSAPDTPEPSPSDGTYSLYIGQDGNFTAYPSSIPLADDPSADPGGLAAQLIAAMAQLTGWNLELGDLIYSGKAGMTVTFGENAALFTGPPDPQKEEFHLYDSADLTFTLLDSIQQTLRMAFAPQAPENLSVWYCGPDGSALSLDSLGVTLPTEEPYSHQMLEELLK